MAAGGGSRWRVVVVVVGMGGLALMVAAMGLALRGSDLPTAANVAQLVSVTR
ncbi:hypothetical protein [Nonomuraea cavernae]|uniref:hypothetical protein n=1 Tax=Nonomuraea cavernae TaxID=2045107 RepID=UPI0033EE49C3